MEIRNNNNETIENRLSKYSKNLDSDISNATPEMARRLKLHKDIDNYLYSLYSSKNSDYGNSVSDTYQKFGIDAFLVRMYDKINRVYSLTRKTDKAKVLDEKIEDTLLDLANYAILTVIELSCEDKK